MGAATKVALKVNQQKVKSLKHNEEVEVDIQGDSAEVNANQGFFGSKGVKVAAGESVEIQTNPTALLLFGIVLALLILSFFWNSLIGTVVMFVGILTTLFFCIKNYYIVKPGSSNSQK